MARFFSGSADEFDSQTFAPQHHGTIEYLRGQVQQIVTGWGDSLTSTAQQFVERAQQTFDKFYSSDALAASRAALRKTQNLFKRDIISELRTLEDFQQAQSKNARYNLAFPKLRSLLHEQMCDGYSDIYIDNEPGAIGSNHNDYRRVYDGQVTEDEEGNTVLTMYIDDGSNPEPEIPFDERIIIRENHTVLEAILAMGAGDPSSASGGTL